MKTLQTIICKYIKLVKPACQPVSFLKL